MVEWRPPLLGNILIICENTVGICVCRQGAASDAMVECAGSNRHVAINVAVFEKAIGSLYAYCGDAAIDDTVGNDGVVVCGIKRKVTADLTFFHHKVL